MTQAPVELDTGYGFKPPSNTQFNVFLDNRVGKMLDLLQVFEHGYLTLAGLSVLDSVDHAVIRLVTSDCALARRLLERHGLPYSETDVLVVELDSEHTLEGMCEVLLRAELNLHYLYPLLVAPRGLPCVALHTDDRTFAAQLLRRKLFTLLGENDLGDNRPHSHPGTPNDPEGV